MNTHRVQVRSGVLGGSGGALAAAALALAVAACTRTMSLGKAGSPDGGDVRVSGDAGDAPLDSPMDLGADSPSTVTCIDHGVTYHPGDIIPRGQPDCPMSCLCLATGEVGHCTGVVCSGDASTDSVVDAGQDSGVDAGQNCVDNGITYHSGDVVLRPGCQFSCICIDGTVGACSGIPCGSLGTDPIPIASITQSLSASSAQIDVRINNFGAATRTYSGPGIAAAPPRVYPPGAPEVTLFRYHLMRVGDLSKVGDPNPLASESCPKSDSSGTRTVAAAGAVSSGDLQCLITPTADQITLANDANVLLGIGEGLDSSNAQACTNTGGQNSNDLCCSDATNFPDSCGVGACSCAPTNLKVVETCVCPSGGCFMRSVGCVGPPSVCTVGADQTCNDNQGADGIHGTCLAGGHCMCRIGFTLVTASGKCS